MNKINLIRKYDQYMELAGMARKDRDYTDELRWYDKAREILDKIKEIENTELGKQNA